MSRWPLILGLCALWSPARAELPIELPPDTPTNQPGPGINVPAPLRDNEPANAVAVPPSEEPPDNQAIPRQPNRRQPLRRMEVPARGQDCLTFANGDRFAGALLDIEDGVIRWRTPADEAPIRFRAAALGELALGAPPPTNATAPPGWLVFLADGSMLSARQVSVEAGSVNADLSMGIHARMERRHVAALRRCGPGACELVTFDGAPAYGISNQFHRTPSRWIRYRDTRLPDPVLVEFEWDGDATSPVAFRPFAGKGEDLHRTAASLLFRLGPSDENGQPTADVQVSGPKESGGGALAEGLTNAVGRPVWVGFAINRGSGEAAFYLDGRHQGRLVLEKSLALPDSGIAVTETPRRRPTPRSVLVSPIGGNLRLPVPPADQDAVRLANGDLLVGTLESVGVNEIAFHAPALGRTVLPLERVAEVTFPRGTNAPAHAAETRFVFRDGSTLRGAWQRADARTVVVGNSALGPVALPRDTLAEATGPLHAAASVRQRSVMYEEQTAIAQMLLSGWTSSYYADRRIAKRLARFEYRPGTITLQSDFERHGDLVAITNGVARWQHPAALDPLTIPLAEALRIFPSARPLPANTGAESATVRLSNGDVLSGPLGAPAGETVNVAPWYAGPLAIPRRHVALVTPHPAVTDALELRWEPLEPELPAPTLADGALWLDWTRVGFRRTLPLPDRMRLDFEAVSFGTGNPLRAELFQRRDMAHDATSFLTAAVHEGGVMVGAAVSNAYACTNLPPIDGMANLARGGCVNVTVFADRTNRHLRILVDGRLAGEWRGADVPVPTGDTMSLTSASGNYAWCGVALRHIVLREWREGQAAPPVSRPLVVPPLSPAKVRVIFHNGDFLTLSDIAANAQTVSGRHALLGPVTLDMAAVRALDWDRSALHSGRATKQ